MIREFKIQQDPYDQSVELFKKSTIKINPGVTVLVGCNGIGKTTLLKNIKRMLEKEDVPVASFDNLSEGGINSRSENLYHGNIEFFALSTQASEGENIVLNLKDLSKKLGTFIRTGEYNTRYNELANAFKMDVREKNKKKSNNERWILFDAVDSGLSVDNIIELKEDLFDLIIETEKDKEIYIIVSANEYEMANGEPCFDVYNGKYITFKNYEEYRNFILANRNQKIARDSVLYKD